MSCTASVQYPCAPPSPGATLTHTGPTHICKGLGGLLRTTLPECGLTRVEHGDARCAGTCDRAGLPAERTSAVARPLPVALVQAETLPVQTPLSMFSDD